MLNLNLSMISISDDVLVGTVAIFIKMADFTCFLLKYLSQYLNNVMCRVLGVALFIAACKKVVRGTCKGKMLNLREK